MKRFIQSVDRSQGTLFPEHLDDYVHDDNPVRVVDVFVEQLDLGNWGLLALRPFHRQAVLPSFSSPQVIHLRLP